MKLCQKCGQIIGQEIPVCPVCGQTVGKGRKFIDDYRIEKIIHEGHASILCRAVKIGEKEPVMIRIFTSGSGVDDAIAARLKLELKELKKLPPEYFVAHQELNRSSDGAWYRVSEWVAALNWGELVAGPRLKDLSTAFTLFANIASILEILHRRGHFIRYTTEGLAERKGAPGPGAELVRDVLAGAGINGRDAAYYVRYVREAHGNLGRAILSAQRAALAD